MFADIIVDIKHEKLDRIFQYRIPEWLKEELNVGMEVVIPFGKGNRQTKGYVVGISETCDYDLSKVKEIEDISRNSVEIEAKLIALAAWMKEHYGGTMIQALKTVLPIKQKENAKIKKYVRLLLGKERAEAQLHYYQQKNQKARARLLEALLEDPVIEYELITKKLNITRSVVNALEEQQVAVLESEQVFRNPVKEKEQRAKTLVFTAEQEHAIECFWQEYSRDVRAAYLLYGVTGSGKTEVYIEMIRRVVSEGKQAIVLIPEIALTYQTVMRFYRRFGNRVSILNSRMSAGERYDQLMRAKAGEIDVMIGPRSALFTPFPELGLIVIDEEHETTYKSEQIPRYHARETAIEPFGNAKDGERLCSGSQAGVKRRQPFDLKPASAGVDGRPAGKTRTDHVVFKQERVCRVSFLQRVRPCGKVSALRCFAVVSQKRKDGLSLLRI